ncbi:hypothetical protein JKP88DRAFT_296656 [Tribonema minus]|uniref:PARP catalytic domain-containing protein n=1 Tax=Tribonema minus TaxID=303371 RepID=A0A835ZLR1_9STRA|nr:hypothetical protein JKP88DRAFT_296656 [Tribonema minus]
MVQKPAAQQQQDDAPDTSDVVMLRKRPAAVAEPPRRFETYAATKPGTIKRCFHGTRSACDLSRIEQTAELKPCGKSHCAACNICKTGFSVNLAKPTGTFGQGTYFTENLAKSQGFGCQARGPRGRPSDMSYLVLVCDVVAGRTCADAAQHVRALPAGYDSIGRTVGKTYMMHGAARFSGVRAEAARLATLMEELVVYRDDASVPRYLVLYTI